MLSPLLEQEIQETQYDGFRVKDLNSCIWCFRKLRALEAKKKEIEEAAKAEILLIEEWMKKQTESINMDMEYFNGLVTEYYLQNKQLDPKFKLSTPYGTVSQRTAPGKITYSDDFITWCEENNLSLLRVKAEIDKEVCKEYFKVLEDGSVVDPSTGEIVPYAHYQDGETKITIKLKEM